MDIFSKREGPRPEDVRAKRMISENAGTIRKLADQISNGGYTRMRQQEAQRRAEPRPEGLLIHDMKARATPDAPVPYVRISLNGRVVLTDQSSGRQLQVLGEIRGGCMGKRFVLATAENGYISPIDDEVFAAIGHLGNAELTQDFGEKDLARHLEECLGLGG